MLRKFPESPVGNGGLFPLGVQVHFKGFQSQTIEQAEVVLRTYFEGIPPPTIIVYCLGAEELRNTGCGDVTWIHRQLMELATTTKCVFKATNPQCYLLGPSLRPYWGIEGGKNARKTIHSLCVNRESLLNDINPPVMKVIWPVDITNKMKQCFKVVSGKLPQENSLGSEILLRGIVRHLGGRRGWYHPPLGPPSEMHLGDLALEATMQNPNYIIGGQVHDPTEVTLCFLPKKEPEVDTSPPCPLGARYRSRSPTHDGSRGRSTSSDSSYGSPVRSHGRATQFMAGGVPLPPPPAPYFLGNNSYRRRSEARKRLAMAKKAARRAARGGYPPQRLGRSPSPAELDHYNVMRQHFERKRNKHRREVYLKKGYRVVKRKHRSHPDRY